MALVPESVLQGVETGHLELLEALHGLSAVPGQRPRYDVISGFESGCDFTK